VATLCCSQGEGSTGSGPCAYDTTYMEPLWKVDEELLNEAFETWVADPTLVDRTERHVLPCAVRTAHAFAPQPPSSSSAGPFPSALQLLPSADTALYFGEDLRVYALGVQPVVGESRLSKHGAVSVLLEPPPYNVGVASTAPSIALVEEATQVLSNPQTLTRPNHVHVRLRRDRNTLGGWQHELHARYLAGLTSCLESGASLSLSLLPVRRARAEHEAHVRGVLRRRHAAPRTRARHRERRVRGLDGGGVAHRAEADASAGSGGGGRRIHCHGRWI
jgi:hypothetical protein